MATATATEAPKAGWRPRLTSQISSHSVLKESGIFNDDLIFDTSLAASTEASQGDKPAPSTSKKRIALEEAEKKYRLKVIRRILKNFSLEDTLDHYRNMSAVSYRVHPKDFSLDCSMPAQHLKDQLIRLTGSDIVMVNDDKYMAKLRQSIWDEYQRKLDKDEKVREEEERQRLRKLLDRGLVTVVQLRDEYNFHMQMKKGRNSSLSPIRRSRQANSSAGNKKKSRRGKDNESLSARGKDSFRVGSRSQTAPGLVSVGRPTYTASLADRTWTPAPPQDKHPKSGDRKDSRRDSTPFEASPRVTLLDDEEEVENDEGIRGSQSPHLAASSPAWLNKYQDPLVSEMKREETVDGLYSLAARLVPLTKKH